MSTRVKYLHGDKTGQVEELEDEVYAQSLLATGYADLAPPPEPETPKVKGKKGKKAAAKASTKKAAKKRKP